MTQCYIKDEERKLTPEQKLWRAKRQQAFPVNVYEGKWNDGMTLRDYLAAHAPVDFVDLDCYLGVHSDELLGKQMIESLARARYDYADAMLKARDAD